MKTLLFLTLCSLLSALCFAAEPPVPPPANATAAQWSAYNNAVAAWNQKTAAEKAAAAAESQRQRALAEAEYRAILARLQAEQEAKAAALRQEQRDQRLLDLIEQQNRLQALELLRKQGKLPK